MDLLTLGFVTDNQFVDTLASFHSRTPNIPIVPDNGATCHRATDFSRLYVTLPPTCDLMGPWRVRIVFAMVCVCTVGRSVHGTDGKGAYGCARQGSSSPDGQNARGRAKRGGRCLSNQPHPLARLPEGRVAVCGFGGRRVIFLSNDNCRIHSLRHIFLAHAATLDQAREATS